MPSTDLARDVRRFTLQLLERAGGTADWPDGAERGEALVPAEIAAAAPLPGESFPLTEDPLARGLACGLAGDFLEITGGVLDFAIAREGLFEISDRYLTRRDLEERLRTTFTWPNARVRYQEAEPTPTEYHLWTWHAALRSEDVWESLFFASFNAANRVQVDLPDVFHEPDVRGGGDGITSAMTMPRSVDPPESYAVAVATMRGKLKQATREFVLRIEQRLDRDRKRIQDYYEALDREARSTKRRGAVAPTPESIAAKKEAVELELRRKLGELIDQYEIRATLRPLTLARVLLPTLVIPTIVQRKQAQRAYKLFWNSLTRKLEPLACSRCFVPTYSPSCANHSVDLLCTECFDL